MWRRENASKSTGECGEGLSSVRGEEALVTEGRGEVMGRGEGEVRATQDGEGGYKGYTGGGGANWHVGRWRIRGEGDSIGGVGSQHGRGVLGRIALVPTMPRWPPVGGHPAMVVAIEMQFRRAQK